MSGVIAYAWHGILLGGIRGGGKNPSFKKKSNKYLKVMHGFAKAYRIHGSSLNNWYTIISSVGIRVCPTGPL